MKKGQIKTGNWLDPTFSTNYKKSEVGNSIHICSEFQPAKPAPPLFFGHQGSLHQGACCNNSILPKRPAKFSKGIQTLKSGFLQASNQPEEYVSSDSLEVKICF